MVYLDNAATTFPKPQAVINGVDMAISRFANPGRGAHKPAMRAAEEVFRCRQAAAKMFGSSPERVIITSGATCSLNIAISAAKSRDGAVLISDLEHNSVLRPVNATKCETRIFNSFTTLNGNERTWAILADIHRKSEGATTLVCTAASNICGASMPIREIGEYCRSSGILFIVDGAQAGGTMDIDMARDNIDILCLPGHKGLFGPMGCGLMILGEGVSIPPLLYGGSGVDSKSPDMPNLPPERYEAGTLPMPLISGLRIGMEFAAKITPQKILEHEKKLARKFMSELKKIGTAQIYCENHIGGIVLFNLAGIPPEDLAARLDEKNICTRAGLHCAPLAHKTLGSDGAVRVSFGCFNTVHEVDYLLNVLDMM